MTVPRNLDQLTDRAADIVRGTVVSARVEKHPELTNLDTVVVTLRVRETLKGSAQGTFTFRQYIWDIRDRYDAAGYRKGQDCPAAHDRAECLTGSRAPPAWTRDDSGSSATARAAELAVNGTGNAAPVRRSRAPRRKRRHRAHGQDQASLVAKHREGPVELGELTAMIRAFARNE